jgi:hypothetical protein
VLPTCSRSSPPSAPAAPAPIRYSRSARTTPRWACRPARWRGGCRASRGSSPTCRLVAGQHEQRVRISGVETQLVSVERFRHDDAALLERLGRDTGVACVPEPVLLDAFAPVESALRHLRRRIDADEIPQGAPAQSPFVVDVPGRHSHAEIGLRPSNLVCGRRAHSRGINKHYTVKARPGHEGSLPEFGLPNRSRVDRIFDPADTKTPGRPEAAWLHPRRVQPSSPSLQGGRGRHLFRW